MLLQMMVHLNLSIIFHKVLRKVFKTFSAVISILLKKPATAGLFRYQDLASVLHCINICLFFGPNELLRLVFKTRA